VLAVIAAVAFIIGLSSLGGCRFAAVWIQSRLHTDGHKKRSELGRQILPAIEPTLADASQVCSHSIEVQARSELKKPLSVQPILQTNVSHAEHFHRKELLGRGHRDEPGRRDLDRAGAVDDFGLDPRACEEKVDAYSVASE
jgi:hypothetical protein